MTDYKSYLGSVIISEERVVTYRLLSRALKIHVNLAKEMLFDFHKQQNSKKPGSVHATYLIAGTNRKDGAFSANSKADGEDEYMQSSPFMSSSMPQPEEDTGENGVLSVTLTREEDLDAVRSRYEHISSIHLYSLGPQSLKDLQVITDTDREIQTLTSSEDPIALAPTYGTITNPHVRRRTPKCTPTPLTTGAIPHAPSKSTTASKSKLSEVQTASQSNTLIEEKKSQPSNAKDFFANSNKGGATGAKLKRQSSTASTRSKDSKEGTPVPPPLAPVTLKRDPSSIFEAFAKTKPKATKKGQGEKKGKEDELMQDVGLSDDGEEDEGAYEMPSAKVDEGEAEGAREEKREREVRLKAMMELDDVEEKSIPEPEAEVEVEEEPQEEEETTTVAGGRRRGRRRVMKKKTFKDEDGYLVTKEEPAWESYSEDEPEPTMKPRSKVHSAPAPAVKAKKDAGKQGQGNIMSFFGKK